MSTMPNIHSCLQLSSENERIRAKCKKLQKRNAALADELRKLKESFKDGHLFQSKGPSRSIQVQTDRKLPIYRPVTSKPASKAKQTSPDDQEDVKSEKLLTMHSNLLKRYQRELKTNTSQIEQIAALTLENLELKKQSEEYQKIITAKEKENGALQTRINNTSIREKLTPSKRDLLADLNKVTKERDKLLNERKRFKEELKMLDRGFFEEIEDLKYALQQSAKLNTAYEAALKRLCKQFGIPLPSVTGSGKKRQKKREQQRQFR